MPLLEIRGKDELIPFRALSGGEELYERELEELFWRNADVFLGEPIFPVKKQHTLSSGGRPDVIALDRSGHVMVVEVKRDVDRKQLSQCLEYAGWARTTNLDELASMYHRGASAFFEDWIEFTGTTTRW